jgi:hypothetical protein
VDGDRIVIEAEGGFWSVECRPLDQAAVDYRNATNQLRQQLRGEPSLCPPDMQNREQCVNDRLVIEALE